MVKLRKGNLKLNNFKLNRSRVNNVKVDGKELHKETERKKNEAKQKRLKMYRTKANLKKMTEKINEVRRIEPSIKWFNSTRTISQNKLELFRNKLEETSHDPFSVVVRRAKIPVELLKEEKDCVTKKYKNENFLRAEQFEDVFSKKKKRKKPKLSVTSIEEFAKNAGMKLANYETENDRSLLENKNELDIEKKSSKDMLLKVGQSKRIWMELYKVIDSSDILLEVLDARDPMGTRCKHLEQTLKKDRPNKHIILILNKVDLIPVKVAEQWIKILSKEYPTIAYHANINNPFGKNDLFNIIRQYSGFLKIEDRKRRKKKHIHIGLIGYPNVGKSAIINSLKKKKVCISACLPGQTRYWQFIKLTTQIYLIDCPGIVPMDVNESEKILRCTIRIEKVSNPEYYIEDILKLVDKKYWIQIYKLSEEDHFTNSDEFLELLAKKMGKLLKGGEPDTNSVSKIVLNDWLKGKIPYFVHPKEYLKKNQIKETASIEDITNEEKNEKELEDNDENLVKKVDSQVETQIDSEDTN